MEQLKKKAALWLIVAVGLCVISMIGASLIQSGGGRIIIKDLRWETTSGHQMSGLFFVPKGVSAQNKVPAIVVCHGMYNSREMQDLNYVELSRRGFVVLAIDMFNHGNSENWGNNVLEVITSMYEAVKMLDSLPYVDSQRIGITGQSLGGLASNAAVGQDNQASQKLIKAVLLNCADAIYINDNTQEYVNIYGGRHAGIIAPQYDEVFFRQSDGKGDATVPREFINNSNAQSFLWFGTDPASKTSREAGTVYRQNVSGSDAMRVIYNPPITHAWSLFSKRSTAATIAFFDEALKAPNPIPANSQIWQWKVFFNFLGLLGFAFFIVAFTSLMLFTPFFSSLRASDVAKPMSANKKNLTWLFGCLAAGILFGTLIYIPVQIGFHAHVGAKELVSQSLTWGVSLWACFCGLFSILCMIISYQVDGKKSGFNLKERGIVIPWPTLGKTVLLAIISVTVSYGLVFIADFFFKTDFRIWLVKVKVFTANKIPVMLFPYLILFLTYYVANSVAVNSFNFIALGKKEWVNTAVLAAAHGLPSLILILLQYIPFAVTGEMGIPSGDLEIMWQFPILIFLPVTAIMTRKIYRLTSNPYLAGIINGIIITIISCTNALTWH